MKFTFACRATGRGGYTTARGKVIYRSRTGNHWIEQVDVDEGEFVTLIDISNTGKHSCTLYRVKDGLLVEIEQADPWAPPCPICEAIRRRYDDFT